MTKKDLLKLLEHCAEDARVTVVTPDGFVHEAEAQYAKAKEGWLKNDEVYFRPASE